MHVPALLRQLANGLRSLRFQYSLAALLQFMLLANLGQALNEAARNYTGRATTRCLATADSSIACLTFARDGKLLAVGGRNGKVRIWRTTAARDGSSLKLLDNPVVLNVLDSVSALDFSSDGERLAIGGFRSVMFWRLADKQLLTSDEGLNGVVGVSWSLGDERVILGTAGSGLCQFDSGGKRLCIRGELDLPQMCAIAWLRDGRILSVHWDGTLYEWKTPSDRPVQLRAPLAPRLYTAAFSDDRRRLLCYDGVNLLLFDLEHGREIGRSYLPPGICGYRRGVITPVLALLPGSDRAVIGGADGQIYEMQLGPRSPARVWLFGFLACGLSVGLIGMNLRARRWRAVLAWTVISAVVLLLALWPLHVLPSCRFAGFWE